MCTLEYKLIYFFHELIFESFDIRLLDKLNSILQDKDKTKYD